MVTVVALASILTGCLPTGSGTAKFTSRPYPVTGVYKSIMGPLGTEKALLIKNHPGELIWLTGSSTRPIGPDDQEASLGFLGQVNIDWTRIDRHSYLMGAKQLTNGRIFSFGQGIYDIRLPSGFAIPTKSNEPLGITTQVMNMNSYTPETAIRFVTELSYTRQRGIEKPMVPLWVASAYSLVSLEEDKTKPIHYATPTFDQKLHGPGCSTFPAASTSEFKDPQGRRFSAHWQVPPGTHTTRTLVTRILNLPSDTTVHHATVQLNPYAVSTELRDLTDQASVLTLKPTKRNQDGTLAEVESYSSHAGVKLYKDHEYELVTIYANTTRKWQDARAVLHLYLRDHDFTVEGIKD